MPEAKNSTKAITGKSPRRPDQNDTDECVRSWENGQTLSFAYVLDFTHTDDEPVKPGVYNLYAYYADEDGNELLDTVLEGVFTVTDP